MAKRKPNQNFIFSMYMAAVVLIVGLNLVDTVTPAFQRGSLWVIVVGSLVLQIYRISR